MKKRPHSRPWMPPSAWKSSWPKPSSTRPCAVGLQRPPRPARRLRPMDIFDALLKSHELQRSICRRLLAKIGDANEREPIFNELKAELAAHETAEERSFHIPLIEHDETVDAARHGIAEHHEMDEMVEE